MALIYLRLVRGTEVERGTSFEHVDYLNLPLLTVNKGLFRTIVSSVACILYPFMIYLKMLLLSHSVRVEYHYCWSRPASCQSRHLHVGTEEKHDMAYNDIEFPGRDFKSGRPE